MGYFPLNLLLWCCQIPLGDRDIVLTNYWRGKILHLKKEKQRKACLWLWLCASCSVTPFLLKLTTDDGKVSDALSSLPRTATLGLDCELPACPGASARCASQWCPYGLLGYSIILILKIVLLASQRGTPVHSDTCMPTPSYLIAAIPASDTVHTSRFWTTASVPDTC